MYDYLRISSDILRIVYIHIDAAFFVATFLIGGFEIFSGFQEVKTFAYKKTPVKTIPFILSFIKEKKFKDMQI